MPTNKSCRSLMDIKFGCQIIACFGLVLYLIISLALTTHLVDILQEECDVITKLLYYEKLDCKTGKIVNIIICSVIVLYGVTGSIFNILILIAIHKRKANLLNVIAFVQGLIACVIIFFIMVQNVSVKHYFIITIIGGVHFYIFSLYTSLAIKFMEERTLRQEATVEMEIVPLQSTTNDE